MVISLDNYILMMHVTFWLNGLFNHGAQKNWKWCSNFALGKIIFCINFVTWHLEKKK
jgi:hypothetical protein